ncbi:hypothetical protein BU17DRAFT_64673 [Hysterangium stoloniferum]|nr:hypothetical protein BU17DRAFT_64673 [Hysterangium stoloniferum]
MGVGVGEKMLNSDDMLGDTSVPLSLVLYIPAMPATTVTANVAGWVNRYQSYLKTWRLAGDLVSVMPFENGTSKSSSNGISSDLANGISNLSINRTSNYSTNGTSNPTHNAASKHSSDGTLDHLSNGTSEYFWEKNEEVDAVLAVPNGVC